MCVRLKQVEEALEGVKNATNEQDLANRFKEFGKEMVKLNYVAARRQQVTERSFHPLCISSEGNKKKTWWNIYYPIYHILWIYLITETIDSVYKQEAL